MAIRAAKAVHGEGLLPGRMAVCSGATPTAREWLHEASWTGLASGSSQTQSYRGRLGPRGCCTAPHGKQALPLPQFV